MKPKLAVLLACVAIACPLAAAVEIDTHRSFLPQDIKWVAAPTSLPGGAEAAVLYGDPEKEGMFALRIKTVASVAADQRCGPFRPDALYCPGGSRRKSLAM